MYFLLSFVLTTGTFCHFLTNCLPAVPSSGGIPSRPAFVPGGQFPADRSLVYKERVSAGPLFPVVVLFLCLRRVTFCPYWQKVTRRRQSKKKSPAGGRPQKLLCKKGVLKPPVSGLPFSLHTTLTSAAASYSTATAPPSPDRRAPAGTDPFRGSRCPR